MSCQNLWNGCLISSNSLPLAGLSQPLAERSSWTVTPQARHLRFDNPFLVNYIIYHHFRSLGWVVKSGIKFCVDYLLYKKGPVFSHAEFAVVIVPVYEDEEDEKSSPWELNNIIPWSWSWLSTVNRVNTQVQKVRFYCSLSNVLLIANITVYLVPCLGIYNYTGDEPDRCVPLRISGHSEGVFSPRSHGETIRPCKDARLAE